MRRAAATFRHLRQSKLRQVFLALRVLLASPRVIVAPLFVIDACEERSDETLPRE